MHETVELSNKDGLGLSFYVLPEGAYRAPAIYQKKNAPFGSVSHFTFVSFKRS